jgi:hypothetical protein
LEKWAWWRRRRRVLVLGRDPYRVRGHGRDPCHDHVRGTESGLSLLERGKKKKKERKKIRT